MAFASDDAPLWQSVALQVGMQVRIAGNADPTDLSLGIATAGPNGT